MTTAAHAWWMSPAAAPRVRVRARRWAPSRLTPSGGMRQVWSVTSRRTLTLVLCAMLAPAAAHALTRQDLRCRGALASAVVRAAVRGDDALARVGGKCRGASATLAAFPDGGPAAALAPAVANETAHAGALLLPAAGSNDAASRRCRRAVSRGFDLVLRSALSAAFTCQRGVDRRADVPSSLDPACVASPGTVVERAQRLVARACRGGDAGACAPLPGCLVELASRAAAPIAAITFGATPGTAPRFDLARDLTTADTFWDLPWPSDLRLDAAGAPDLRGYPYPAGNPILGSLASVAAERPGFPTDTLAYVRFDGPIAAQDVRTPIFAADAPLLLLDVDPASAERGRLFPLVAHAPTARPAAADDYRVDHLLSVATLPGTILPPSRRLALVVRRSLGDAAGDPLGVPLPVLQLRAGGSPPPRDDLRPHFASLWETLDALGVPREDVAAATVFTTGDVVASFAALGDALLARDTVTIDDLALDAGDSQGGVHDRFCVLRGRVAMPQYQAGIPPFDTNGRFVVGDDGLPVVQRTEDVPVVVTIPRRPMPAAGFPLVVYLHGSGGLAAQVVDRGPFLTPDGEATPGEGPSFVLAAHGIATVGPAMPLNPERAPGLDKRAYLNFANLAAYPYTFRQGTLEQRLLLRALDAVTIPPGVLGACTLPAPTPSVRFATDRVGVLGQSMGAQYANMLAAVEPRVAGVVPTGSGGMWGMVLLEAESVDGGGPARALAVAALNAPEPITHLHPGFNLQTLGWEWAETAVFAARIASDPLPGHPQRSIYLPVADDDPGFPNTIYTAMALASGVEQAGSVLYPGLQDALATRGLDGLQSYPVGQNVTSTAGAAYTGVVAQYHSDGIKDGHYIFGQLDAVKRQYGCFFETLLADGTAVVPSPEDLGAPCPR